MPPTSGSRRRTTLAAAGLVAVAALALSACDGNATGSSAAGASTGRPAASPSMSMPMNTASVKSELASYDPANQADATFYAAALSGLNEIPNADGSKTGDKDGTALALLRIQGDQISFAFSWRGIGTPTAGHIHAGTFGHDGPVKIPFFTTRLADGSTSVYGTATVNDAGLLASIKAHPGAFYVNLHTAEFPGGAVRGQLMGVPAGFNLLSALKDTSVASVEQGAQIYACTKSPDGSFAFTQNNVDAHLQGGIHHTFKVPGPAGPAQWVAADGSAVTGEVLGKFDNGAGNVPELALQAHQEGAATGLLAHTTAVLRLNTHGGVAPAGTCDPATQPTAAVPYTAAYVFLGGK